MGWGGNGPVWGAVGSVMSCFFAIQVAVEALTVGGRGRQDIWHWVCHCAGQNWACIAGCCTLASRVIVGGWVMHLEQLGILRMGSGA
jgi:hypothetical protein